MVIWQLLEEQKGKTIKRNHDLISSDQKPFIVPTSDKISHLHSFVFIEDSQNKTEKISFNPICHGLLGPDILMIFKFCFYKG